MSKTNTMTPFARFWRRVMALLDELLFPEETACLCCGRALGEDAQDGICPACVREMEALQEQQEEAERSECPLQLAFVHAAYVYHGPVRRLVRLLKFGRVRAAAIPLARAMAMLPAGEEEIIVPVPTTKRRLRERGFNQSALLAQLIARELGMPMAQALERVDDHRPQSSLSGDARASNLSGCMRAITDVFGKRILLVDDVYTTGATAREAARALMDAGAASVGIFAAARSREGANQPVFERRGSRRSQSL